MKEMNRIRTTHERASLKCFRFASSQGIHLFSGTRLILNGSLEGAFELMRMRTLNFLWVLSLIRAFVIMVPSLRSDHLA